MKKLSETLFELSQHTATLENEVETTRAQDRREFQTHISEARARVQSFQQAFTASLDEMDAAIAEDWRALDEAFAAQITRTQRQIDEDLNALDLADARAEADAAETYAGIAAEFAKLATAEAEAAMVEAKEARVRATSLEH